MSTKNSVGRVLLTVGLLLSLSFYATYGITKSFDILSNFTIQLHDTYINVSVWFVWIGLFSVLFCLYSFVTMIINKLKSAAWNITFVASLALLSSFLFYGKAIFDFGFSLLGRMIDTPSDGGWTVYPPLSDLPKELLEHQDKLGSWETMLQHTVFGIIGLSTIVSIFILIRTFRLYKSK